MSLPLTFPPRHVGFTPKQVVAYVGATSMQWTEEEAADAEVVEGALESVVEEMAVVVAGATEEDMEMKK